MDRASTRRTLHGGPAPAPSTLLVLVIMPAVLVDAAADNATYGIERCHVGSGANATLLLVESCTHTDECLTRQVATSLLPDLPEATEHTNSRVADACHFDGTINLAAPLSLRVGNTFFDESREMRRCIEMAVSFINDERGGVHVGNKRLALHFMAVNDGSDMQQITNATAHASREGDGAHFLIGPFGSSLTKYAAQQSFLDGKIMMAPAVRERESNSPVPPIALADGPSGLARASSVRHGHGDWLQSTHLRHAPPDDEARRGLVEGGARRCRVVRPAR